MDKLDQSFCHAIKDAEMIFWISSEPSCDHVHKGTTLDFSLSMDCGHEFFHGYKVSMDNFDQVTQGLVTGAGCIAGD